jgi:HAD superfamily hydrolase (TIGR01509 family)
MGQLQALLFDVDGTLADTERDGHRIAFNMAFSEAGLDWTWSEELYGKLLSVTGGKERIRHYLDQYNKEFIRPDDLDGFVAGLHAAKTRFYTNLLATGKIPLRKGVARILNEARQAGLRLGIVTTTTPANVFALLSHALHSDAHEWFDVIAAGDIVPAKKPAPDIYLHALDLLQLPAEQCMAFEDSANGLKSARDAGLQTIVTVNNYTRNEDFTGATLVLDHMGEPDASFTVLQGETVDASAKYLSVDLIKQLHRC